MSGSIRQFTGMVKSVLARLMLMKNMYLVVLTSISSRIFGKENPFVHFADIFVEITETWTYVQNVVSLMKGAL